MPDFLVFISSRTNELRNERIAIKKLEVEFQNEIAFFIFEDDAGASSKPPDEIYRDQIINSKVYVGIFRNEYSKATEEEFRLAEDKGKIILIYKDDNKSDKRDSKVVDLLEEIKKGHTIESFQDIEDLKSKIKRDVLRILTQTFPQSDPIEVGEFQYLGPNYFDGKLENVEQWKKGFPLNLVAIRNNRQFIRHDVVNEIKQRLQRNNVLILLGRKGYSKTTLLYEMICHYHENGYMVFHLDGSIDRITSPEKIIEKFEHMLKNNRRIFITVDNAHVPSAASIFYIINSLKLNSEYQKNIVFLLTARIPEINYLTNLEMSPVIPLEYRDVPTRYIDSVSILTSDLGNVYELPPFSKEEAKEFILKNDENSKKLSPEEFEKYSTRLYEQSQGYPIILFFLILHLGLEAHIRLVKREYLTEDNALIAMIACSLLSLSNIKITDKNLQKMDLIQDCNLLANKTLRRDDGKWHTIHTKWDEEFLMSLFKNSNDYYNNIKHLKSALQRIGDLKIDEITYRVLLQTYGIAIKLFPSDPLDEIKPPDYFSDEKRSYLYSDVAQKYFEIKKFSKAIDLCNIASSINPDNWNAFSIAGNSYHFLGRNDEAVSAHKQALNLDPDKIAHHINLILSLRILHPSEAEEVGEAAIKKFENNTSPSLMSALLNNIGSVYLKQKKFKRAKELYKKSNQAKKNQLAYHNLGLIEFYKHHYERALQCFSIAYSMDTNFSPSLEFKINSLKMLGKDRDAEVEMENMKKIEPSFHSIMKNFYETTNWKDFFLKNIWWRRFSKVPDVAFEQDDPTV